MREGLEVHPTPLEWLRAGCHGVVILDPAKAAPLLRRAAPLQASSVAHGRVLRKILDVKPDSDSRARLRRQEGRRMNELVDLEQAERIASLVQRLRIPPTTRVRRLSRGDRSR